jgi:hypothetical protein
VLSHLKLSKITRKLVLVLKFGYEVGNEDRREERKIEQIKLNKFTNPFLF